MEHSNIELNALHRESISAHAIISYLQKFCEFHDKIMILENVSEKLVTHDHKVFKIGKSINGYFDLDNDTSIMGFFNAFSRKANPQVFHQESLLYNYNTDVARITSLSFNSPLVATVTVGLAVAGFILDENRKEKLFKLDYEIKQTQLEAERMRLQREAMETFCRAEAIRKSLEHPHVNPKYKSLMTNYLYQATKDNIYMNERAGIIIKRFDTRI